LGWIGDSPGKTTFLARADWAPLLEQREQDASELRAATYAGLPHWEPEFVEQLERGRRATAASAQTRAQAEGALRSRYGALNCRPVPHFPKGGSLECTPKLRQPQ